MRNNLWVTYQVGLLGLVAVAFQLQGYSNLSYRVYFVPFGNK